MKLRIELTWFGGIVEEGAQRPPPEPLYDLCVWDDSGRVVAERSFEACLEMEAYIRQSWSGVEREALPPAGAEDVARLERAFALLERSGAKEFDPDHLRAMLAGMLYQWSHPPETTARLRGALGLPPAG